MVFMTITSQNLQVIVMCYIKSVALLSGISGFFRGFARCLSGISYVKQPEIPAVSGDCQQMEGYDKLLAQETSDG